MKTIPFVRSTLGALIALMLVSASHAGNLAVDQSSLDGGGGTSSGGRFTVTGSVGQPDAGMMRGGSFAVEGGLWSLFTVVQTPGAPVLKIVRSGATAVLSWPAAEGTFQLQSNPDLAVANGWANVPQNATTNNGSVSVTVQLSPGSKFFRLKK